MSTKNKEKKSVKLSDSEKAITQHLQYSFEVKSVDLVKVGEDEYYDVSGYASEFNGKDSYGDRVEAGAYKETIAKNPDGFPALFMHKSMDIPVGLWYELREDAKGLFVRCRLPKKDTEVEGRIVPQIKARSINALSIGWRPVEVDWDGDIRVLKKIDLREISFITKGYQADSGALITELKNKLGENLDVVMANAMVDVKRKGATQEVKSQISDFYHEKGKIDPFSDGAVISLEELKYLTKSNCAFAIRELKVSANASSHLAGLIVVTPKSDEEDPDVKNDNGTENNKGTKEVSLEVPTVPEVTEGAEVKSEDLQDFLNTFKSLNQSITKNGES